MSTSFRYEVSADKVVTVFRNSVQGETIELIQPMLEGQDGFKTVAAAKKWADETVSYLNATAAELDAVKVELAKPEEVALPEGEATTEPVAELVAE